MVLKTKRIERCNFKGITLKNLRKQIHLSKSFDLYDLKYNKPENSDIAIGLVYFNSAKSKRLLMNYLYIVEKFKTANIAYFTLEMYEESPEIADAIHLKTNFILFQKERLCYLLEKYIPKSFKKLLFMDCDLVFSKPNWYDELSSKLEHFNIVQPFSKALWLDITYKKIVKQRYTVVYYKHLKKNIEDGTNSGGFNPGFAWAFQRDWFNKHGFFQYAVLGGGDGANASIWLDYNYINNGGFMKNSIEDYRKILDKKPTICFLGGYIYHLFHGDVRKRQYKERNNIFIHIKDIRDIIRVANNGLFELKDDSLKAKIRKYFRNRDDDGLAIEQK